MQYFTSFIFTEERLQMLAPLHLCTHKLELTKECNYRKRNFIWGCSKCVNEPADGEELQCRWEWVHPLLVHYKLFCSVDYCFALIC